MGNGDSYEVDMESKHEGVLDIHEDAFVIAYLQVVETPIILTTNEHDYVVHTVKQFKWESNSFLQMG
jgi:hypothetical protein